MVVVRFTKLQENFPSGFVYVRSPWNLPYHSRLQYSAFFRMHKFTLQEKYWEISNALKFFGTCYRHTTEKFSRSGADVSNAGVETYANRDVLQKSSTYCRFASPLDQLSSLQRSVNPVIWDLKKAEISYLIYFDGFPRLARAPSETPDNTVQPNKLK